MMHDIIQSGKTFYLNVDGFLFFNHSHNTRRTVQFWIVHDQYQKVDGATLSNRRHSLHHSHALNREEVETLRI